MVFAKTQLGLVLESIKRAYAAGYPIVYIPTSQEELINGLFFSSLCQNQVIPGLTITQIKDSESKSTELFYGLCDKNSFAPDNYRINESVRFDVKKEIAEVPFLFINFGTWDKEKNNYIGSDVSTFIEKRYLSKYNGQYISEKEKKAASHSLFVAITPVQEPIPPEFSQYVKIIDVPTISDEEVLDVITNHLRDNGISISSIGEARMGELVVQLRGFTRLSIQTLISSMIIRRVITAAGSNWKDIKDIVYSAKKEVLSSSKSLKWEDKDGQNAVGLGSAEQWLKNRAPLFEDTAISVMHGHEIPKGILLSGIPGSGKSLMAKETARVLNLPLISLDMGAIRGGIVGESEHNMISELKLAESMAPCVLWIDEIEKAFSGSSSSSGDNGVSQRLFGKFLTWLQEKKSACFVFATSNDITSLPPELFRSERFDRKFYTFFPTVVECAEIMISYIRSSNDTYKRTSGEPELLFDPELLNKKTWIELFNRVCASEEEYRRISLSFSHGDGTKDEHGMWNWKDTTKPKVKIFSGADISAIIKEAKFLVRLRYGEVGEYDVSARHDYRFSKEDFLEIVQIVIQGGCIQFKSRSVGETIRVSEFKPYGETNQRDIAKCFIKLSENQFLPASEHELVRLSNYDREACKYDLDENWSMNSQTERYDQVLFSLIVGAVNLYAKGISEEK